MRSLPPDRPLRLVSLCAIEDRALLDDFDRHLSALKAGRRIEHLHRGALQGGMETSTIDGWLAQADLVICLLSADFLADPECGRLSDEAIRRRLPLLPLRVRDVNLEGSPYAGLQFVPQRGPIQSSAWPGKDEGWAAAVAELRRTLGLPVASGALHPIISERRLYGLAVALLLALLVAAGATLWPPLVLPPVPDGRGGVVVAAPWLAAPTVLPPLCAQIEQRNPGGVRCIRLPLWIQPWRLQNLVRASGAVLLVALERGDGLRLVPLHAGSRAIPLDGLPLLSAADGGIGAAPAIDIVRRLLGPKGIDCEGGLPDPRALQPEFAILGVVLQWQCQGGRPRLPNGSAAEYSTFIQSLARRLCREQKFEDPACAQVQYFAALDCPPDAAGACEDARQRLHQLADGAPTSRLRWISRLEWLRRTCSLDPAESARELLAMDFGARSACDRQELLPMISCVLTQRVRLGQNVQVRLTYQEDLIHAEQGCAPDRISDAMSESAGYYLKAAMYPQAVRACRRSHELSPGPSRAMDLAEALLMAGTPQQVSALVVPDQFAEPSMRSHASFLLWLADPTEENALRLLANYGAVAPGGAGAGDTAGNLKRFCSTSPRSRGVLAVLVAPKSDTSAELLRQELLSEARRSR